MQDQDEGLKANKEILKNGSYQDYCIENDLLYKGELKQLVIPKTLEKEIIKRTHGIGHFSCKKMKQIISNSYYINQWDKKLQDFMKTCIPCLLAKRKSGKQKGFLHPIEKKSMPLHTLHIDHIGPLMEAKKQYNYILTMVDAFTKFTWIFPTKSTTNKETLDKLKIFQQHFGNPDRIITDKGTAFTVNDFREFCETEGIQHISITTGVPRGNGQVERVHRKIISVLTKLCSEDPSFWYKHVNRLQRALNSTYHRTIDTTSFTLTIGTKLRQKEDLEIIQILQSEEVEQYNRNREDLRVKAKHHILKVQEENRRNLNKHRKEGCKYEIGDFVAIKRTQFGVGLKLRPK
ncbi:unnamed protein product [Parnassius mnemosyne]|uniref:RNA-directed DNA polymerase n=1 Tax=Parnassius mnemosyne TaxID=213953 RepID=A0AAV1LYB7_9NEOP